MCTTNIAITPDMATDPPPVLLAFIDASNSRILAVREAALNTLGQGDTGVCLDRSAQELLAPAGAQNPINVVAIGGTGLTMEQGFLIEGGGIPGGGCLVASLQVTDPNSPIRRHIPMIQH